MTEGYKAGHGHLRVAGRLTALACLALLALATWAAPAVRAADSVYWTDLGPDTIRVANLDGTGAAATLFAEAFGSDPIGVAIDPAANRIYWANNGPETIRVANLDGSGAAATLFAETVNSSLVGVAIDPAAGRIYWANAGTDTIRVANLDGSGAAATLFGGENSPGGVAIDPAAGKIYWTNFLANTIRVANLDGSGAAATLFAEPGGSFPVGVAIDPAANKIYWANEGLDTIRVANLDGTGAAATLFAEAGGSTPRGVAIDPGAGRIYWADVVANTIRVANLDGTGAAATLFAEAFGRFPAFPALLRSPQGTGAPLISGGGGLGQPLACTQGSWAPDLLGAFLFRAPRSFAFQWLLNGGAIGGATGSTHTPTQPGAYACRVTASNQAGSASQTSAALHVADFSFGRLKRNTNKGIAHLQVLFPRPGQIGYRGKGERRSGRSRADVSREIEKAGGAWFKIKPGRFGKRTKAIRRQLKRDSGKAKVKVFVTYLPAGGAPNTKPRKLTLVRR